MIWKLILFLCLYMAFLLLFLWLRKESIIQNVLRNTYESMEAAARRRVQDNRKNLVLLQKKKGRWYKIEQRLIYSGLLRLFPLLTLEIWIVGNLIFSGLLYLVLHIISGNLLIGIGGMLVCQFLQYIVLNIWMSRNYRIVNENLLKFLDFLGNYSITAGEVTSILNQISKYMEEPLQSVLSECYYEAQTSGDASLALLSMAEKIEHPKFKELVRNMEISIRYSADFTVLVQNSRRAVREHLRSRQERRSLTNEAFINMFILLVMSIVVLMAVEQLIEASIWNILFHTLPGKIGLGIIGFVFFLFYRQVRKIDC